MSYSKDVQYKITAKDATTATLVPVNVSTETPAPTQIVLTFAATPASFIVNRIVSVKIYT